MPMTDPSNFVNQHADRWTIPESMVEHEKKIAALEQRFDALSSKFAALVEENATLRKRLDESCRFTVDPDSEFAKDSMELKEGDNANSSHILG